MNDSDHFVSSQDSNHQRCDLLIKLCVYIYIIMNIELSSSFFLLFFLLVCQCVQSTNDHFSHQNLILLHC